LWTEHTLVLNSKTGRSAALCHVKTREMEQHKHTLNLGDNDLTNIARLVSWTHWAIKAIG
jgi:hypothetical protein